MDLHFIYTHLFVKPAYPTTSFAGQTVIVTGANVGLGLEAARHFTRLDAARVIMAVRNLSAGDDAKRSIEQSTGRTGVCEVWELDLASHSSVKSFAARVSAELPRVDAVVENAGVAKMEFDLVEGHERTIAVNVINTFLLALLLLPKLEQTARDSKKKNNKNNPNEPSPRAPRLTIVSSSVHGLAKFAEASADNTFATLSDPATADISERYQTSKLLEVLVVRHLAPQLAASDSGVVLNMLNPGFCHSELGREAGWGLWLLKQPLARMTEVGARTLVAAAAAGAESHGKYMDDGVVNDGTLSPFVKSEEGGKVGRKVWRELREILEEIEPGVTRNLE